MKRKKITISGIVQGVGYRPFVYKYAVLLGVKGYVQNTNHGLIIDAQAPGEKLIRFTKLLQKKHPSKAYITGISVKGLKPCKYKSFKVKQSFGSKEKSVLISPDLSICKKCVKEFSNKKNRRYMYPFITCTSCGPRFSIVFDTPYDRVRTSMKKFKMCPECNKEYKNPKSHRFHTETNSCAICGPELSLYKNRKKIKTKTPTKDAIKLIKNGKILAIKGLGGFHLICDASNNKAVEKLRKLKDRNKKAFAIMCKNAELVKKLCKINSKELKLLECEEKPIVLLEKLKTPRFKLSNLIAPDNKYLGVMLPYTPIHHLILGEKLNAIVATSANLSEEPICSTRQEVEKKLSKVAEYILDHNREIHTRIDDSVVRIMNNKISMIRRARGYVPVPVKISGKKEILSLGAEMKNTFTIVKNGLAFVSQHIGDLKSPESFDHFKQTINYFKKVFQVEPKVLVHDLHPNYLSTKYAGTKSAGAQHHHAHIASCMAENGINEKVIGVAFDGMGMGLNGKIWGAEFLIADYHNFKRFAHLKEIPLPGGDKASKEPWRMAVSYLYHTFGRSFLKFKKMPLLKEIPLKDINMIISMIEKEINCPNAVSMGRLFDAVSALLGICYKNSYEGEAAAELEYAIQKPTNKSYKFEIIKDDGSIIIDPTKMVQELVKELLVPDISAKFHNTIVNMIFSICKNAREQTGLNKVCLSGGCFQNKYLTEKTVKVLSNAKFEVYIHSLVPANDGGISLGQAAIAESY